MPVYLDYNATKPIDNRVLDRMIDVYRYSCGNADSRTHIHGSRAREITADARRAVSEVLGIDSMELVFTSGVTESNNIAIRGMMQHALSSGRSHFITTSIEHKSVLEPMKNLMKHGCSVDFVNPGSSGRICADEVLKRVNERTLLVSVMHVNSETGIIQPVQELGDALLKTGVYFHVDATQSLGRMNDRVRGLKYDLMSFSGHKFGAPQGIGGLVMRRGSDYKLPPVEPLFLGGHQERGFRAGTTPVALVAGLAEAAVLCEAEYKEEWDKCMGFKSSFLEAIDGLSYHINGDPNYCVPSTINISFKGVDSEGLFVALKDYYSFSNGSACTSGGVAPSYVLSAMGLDRERIASALRLSWGGSVKADFSALVNYIKSMV